jgi:hypothetical protein
MKQQLTVTPVEPAHHWPWTNLRTGKDVETFTLLRLVADLDVRQQRAHHTFMIRT